jgi:hypothetical protein
MAVRGHTRGHPINDADDHTPGTNNTVLGTEAAAISEIPFDAAAATINTLARRDANGDVIVPATPTASDAATSKSYVDALVNGISVKPPVQVINMISDAAGAVPGSPSISDAYVVDTVTGLWSGFALGDIVVWDGSAWQLVLAGSGGAPADGARVVVTGIASGAGAGSFAGQDRARGLYTTGPGWSFQAAVEGDAVVVIGENTPEENTQYVFDGPDNVWNIGQAQSQNHQALAGLQGGSPTERFHLSSAAATLAENHQALVTGTSDPPAASDGGITSGIPANEDYAFVRDTNNNMYLVVRDSGSYFGVELSLLTP